MTKLRLTALVLLGCLSSLAQAIDFETFSQQMREKTHLTGQFVQEKHITGFPKPLISNGHFQFVLKDGIEWTTERPLSSKTRLTPSAITVENQFGRQSITNQTHPLIGVIGTLMMSLFSADTQVFNQHFICSAQKKKNGWELALTPQSDVAKTLFQSMNVLGDRYPETITIIEKSGDHTVIRFQNVKVQSVKQ